jgi:hypothetical protein
MRPQEEIVKKVQESDSLLGFELEVLIQHLDYEHAKPFLNKEFVAKPDAEERWAKEAKEHTDEVVKQEMAQYMAEFGWPKAEGHRGISANRTIEKMFAWLWLLGDEETTRTLENAPYENYGCPMLAIICKRYNLPIPDSVEVQNMINSRPCCDSCPSCGKE